jgi:hypothetical protein
MSSYLLSLPVTYLIDIGGFNFLRGLIFQLWWTLIEISQHLFGRSLSNFDRQWGCYTKLIWNLQLPWIVRALVLKAMMYHRIHSTLVAYVKAIYTRYLFHQLNMPWTVGICHPLYLICIFHPLLGSSRQQDAQIPHRHATISLVRSTTKCATDAELKLQGLQQRVAKPSQRK